MSSRTYLSIGDVLALLRQEFPDVTISKIRFLESQGLVNPERTPSGYRKFYEHDVERLRWVLRQQREHFLPLKVIKGRLEQEVADDGEGLAPHVERGATKPTEPVLVGRASRPGAQRGADHELPGFESPAAETTRRAVDGGPGRQARPSARPDLARGRPVPAAAAVPSTVSSPSASGRPAGAAPGAGRSTAGTGASRPAGAAVAAAPRPGTTRGGARPSGPKPAATPAPGAPKGPGASATGRSAGSALGRPVAAEVDTDVDADELVLQTLSGTSMTMEELAEGCGLDVLAVEQLESYGLLCGRVVGGVAYYDEDALVVARLAEGLARYGVEARHLRLHKHAAEREAGFIEQIVLPLLKQRNPEARQRAHEVVTELTMLSQGLREVLLRTTLRDQLGG